MYFIITPFDSFPNKDQIIFNKILLNLSYVRLNVQNYDNYFQYIARRRRLTAFRITFPNALRYSRGS